MRRTGLPLNPHPRFPDQGPAGKSHPILYPHGGDLVGPLGLHSKTSLKIVMINPYNAVAILNFLNVIFNSILKQAGTWPIKKRIPKSWKTGFYT